MPMRSSPQLHQEAREWCSAPSILPLALANSSASPTGSTFTKFASSLHLSLSPLRPILVNATIVSHLNYNKLQNGSPASALLPLPQTLFHSMISKIFLHPESHVTPRLEVFKWNSSPSELSPHSLHGLQISGLCTLPRFCSIFPLSLLPTYRSF